MSRHEPTFLLSSLARSGETNTIGGRLTDGREQSAGKVIFVDTRMACRDVGQHALNQAPPWKARRYARQKAGPAVRRRRALASSIDPGQDDRP
jgi:hypothetical protein